MWDWSESHCRCSLINFFFFSLILTSAPIAFLYLCTNWSEQTSSRLKVFPPGMTSYCSHVISISFALLGLDVLFGSPGFYTKHKCGFFYGVVFFHLGFFHFVVRAFAHGAMGHRIDPS